MLLDKPIESHPIEPNVELPPPSFLKRKIIIKNKKKHHHHHHHKKGATAANTITNNSTTTSTTATSVNNSATVISTVTGKLCKSNKNANLFIHELCFILAVAASNQPPSNAEEEVVSITAVTGNGDVTHHAPPLQVFSIYIIFLFKHVYQSF